MKTKFTTICSREKLSEIRAFLSSVLVNLSVAESVKNEIILAVDEACANAMIHGNNCDEDKPLQLEVEHHGNKLTVEISDIGDSEINVEEYQDRTIDDLIRERRKGGLGLKLIYSIMDDVSYYSRDSRNICALTKIIS